MDPEQKKKLRENQVKFVQDLEPRDVLDHLQADGILTENDCERISSGRSRKDRCQLLLSLLPTRGPTAYGSFKRALHSTKYKQLEQALTDLNLQVNQTIPKRVGREIEEEFDTRATVLSGVCSKCKPLLPSKWSNADLERLLGTHCCLFMQNVEPNDLIDYHYQENIISDDEYDRVRAGQTRKDRFITFLQEISKCPKERVVPVLQGSLEKKYGYIAERIQDSNRDNTNLKTISESTLCENSNRSLQETYTHSPTGDVMYRDIHESRQRDVFSDLTVTSYPPLNVQTLENQTDDKKLSRTNTSSYETTKLMKIWSEEGYRDCTVTTQKHPLESMNHSALKSVTDEEHLAAQTEERDLSLITMCGSPSFLELEPLSSKYENSMPNSIHVHNINENLRDGNNVHSEKDQFPENEHIENTEKHEDCRCTESPAINENVAHKMRKSGTLKRRNETRGNIKQQTNSNENSAICNWQSISINDSRECVFCQPGSIKPLGLPSKKLEVAFNCLSTLINTGQFEKFENLSYNLRFKYRSNPDMMCILGYLHASRDLFKTEFDSAKKHINTAFEIVPKTSNPKYFTIELFTAKTRMYITQKKLDKLEKTLDDAKMIIETDPVGCTGRAAGWLYMNDARNKTAQISTLNCSSRNFSNAYCSLHKSATQSFQRALVNFQQDGGTDGPFGFGYALCRLVILLLRCGDNGLTMDVLIPPSEDVPLAGKYLRQLEDSEVAIPKILELHFLLAKCDYQFRKGNIVRAMEYAQSAFDVATELNLLEFTEHAHNRLVFLRTKNPIRIHEITDDEISKILFNDESDSDDFSDRSFSS